MFETLQDDDTATHYETLDIPPSAAPSIIREAYLRAKSAYNKDSVALYSLIDPSERDLMLRKIEEAYDVLSNEDRRREYDARHGIIENTGTIDSRRIAKIVSIDRIPPMESMSSEEDPLIAPSTDIPTEVTRNPLPPSIAKQELEYFISAQPPQQQPTAGPPKREVSTVSDIEREILGESEWRGSFIRRVREANGVSIEEMSNITKIGKSYINAIEAEEFKKLPALVFMRGFLVQVCRVLKLPQEKVLDAYLQRFKAAKALE